MGLGLWDQSGLREPPVAAKDRAQNSKRFRCRSFVIGARMGRRWALQSLIELIEEIELFLISETGVHILAHKLVHILGHICVAGLSGLGVISSWWLRFLNPTSGTCVGLLITQIVSRIATFASTISLIF